MHAFRLFSKISLSIFLAGTILFFYGCGGGDGGSGISLPINNGSIHVVVMGSGSFAADGKLYPYQLLRIEIEGKEPAYAQWFPRPDGKDAPVVMMTDPYGGITWNGDQPPMSAADISTPEKIFNAVHIYLLNGFAALNVFGRFYTGGDIQNDLDDMVAGLRFLAQASGVMKDRIGIVGGSWGGFEALYAAAHAPDGVVPRAGVALSPVSDFQEFMDFITVYITATITDETKLLQYQTFFAPFIERITAATQGDYSHWTRAYLLSKLKTEFLVTHDQWDTLIPFRHSFNLAAESAGMVSGLWFLKGSAADLNALPYGYAHGDMQAADDTGTPFSLPLSITLYLSYLMNRIALPDQTLLNGYDPDALNYFVFYLKRFKDTGTDMEWAAPRLLDLADARLVLVNMDNPEDIRTGASEVARAVNLAWGTTLDETTIRAALAGGLPPY